MDEEKEDEKKQRCPMDEYPVECLDAFYLKRMYAPHQQELWRTSVCSPVFVSPELNLKYTRKIRFYPTMKQKEVLQDCFNATRYLWNKAIAHNKTLEKIETHHFALRKAVLLTDEQLKQPEHQKDAWLLQVPYDTRDLVLKQLASNYKTNFTLLQQKKITHFEMEFKRKKNPYQICYVNKKALDLQTQQLFKRRTKDRFRIRNRDKKQLDQTKEYGEFVIRREKNRYYLCLPMTLQKKKSTSPLRFIPQTYNRCALDPGVRTFQTFYSDQGITGKIGEDVCEKLIDFGLLEDQLKAKIHTLTNKRTRYNARKRCFLLRTKIKNIVKDLHWKTCNYLCSTFTHILLPSFEVSNMIRKDLPQRARAIRSKTVRQMLSLSHYAFKERLLYMGRKKGCQIDIVNEAYTTKTCGGCGQLKEMGGLKRYCCVHCGFTMDRDYNGARNIFLKYLSQD